MPEITTLSAQLRAGAGKRAARTTRRSGRVPGIIYGDNKEPVLISLEPRELSRALANRGFFATLVDIRIDGTVYRTLPRDLQQHPATDKPLHVDFMRVGGHTRVIVTVPVVFANPEMSPGIRRGGILNIVRHGIELSCPVENIPDRLVVELNGLEIGDSIHISHVIMPEDCRPTIAARDFTIATIAASSAVREEAAAAAATVPEPEEPLAASS
ncbi:MAG: 50S ribosomal protein L25/general stress protein Ctc [Alphaproteobacteria bacterium]|nr:50S ribosomal protein L25/general stress protein Ctc [Alphaproteobacteria bacterium]